tara:strand:- start:89 stop:808 length:720 start_codon:yes stop_codon:yes gene_type:complete
MEVDDIAVGKRLFVGVGNPELLGRGSALGPIPSPRPTVRGSSYIEGPQIIGQPSVYLSPVPTDTATLMVAPTTNVEMQPTPFYSLIVTAFARIRGYLKIDTLLSVPVIKSKVILTKVLLAKVKNFNISHPTRENMRLVHSCLEGPEIGVYFRGRLTGKTVINLPDYWTGLVHETSITVSLTPIGAHQDIIIKRVGQNKIHLQSKGNMPIDCYYHVFAERKDVDKLEVEIEDNGEYKEED